MTIMAALCAAAGLIVVQRIGGSITDLADVTSPLLMESRALVDNAHRMRSAYLEGTDKHDASAQVLASLADLRAEGRERLAEVKKLAARARLAGAFDAVDVRQADYVATLRDMTAAYVRGLKADAAVAEQSKQVDAALVAAEKILLEIAFGIEIKIIGSEETAKVRIQTRQATVDGLGELFAQALNDSFPGLQYAYKLLRATAHFEDLARAVVESHTAPELAGLEKEIDKVFKTTASVRRKLATRLRAPEQAASLTALTESLARLESALLGNEGLVAAKHASLSAVEAIAAGSASLNEIEHTYLKLLLDVETVVRASNSAAREQTATAILTGRTVIAILLVLTTVLAMGAALLVTHGILGPVDRLTRHVRTIRGNGALTGISEPSMLASADEVGELARSFNGMIVELAQARQELIARSEQEIAKQVDRLEAALANMSQGLCMYDGDQRLIIANRRYAEIYDLDPGSVQPGLTLREVLEQRVAVGSYYGDAETHIDQRVISNAVAQPSETIVELKNGRIMQIVRRPMKSGGWVATHEDITERRRSEARIAHMARHDALTNLPNRMLFRERMEEALTRVARGHNIAVLCLDLDHFKAVNDTLGHPIGDALLRAVTQRLLACVRETDTISRLGGDEFAIIQVVAEGVKDPAELAQRIINAVSEPYDLDGHQVIIGVSIGITIAPDDGVKPDELLKNADLALYRAKAEARGTFRFFEPEMDARMQERRHLELDLRKGFAAGEFELFYQPFINLQTNVITGFEALLRWHHPERGTILPQKFIGVAEEIGLIVPLGEWVIRQACQQAATWPSAVRVAVNLSPVQFKSPHLVPAVELALSSTGLASDRLELEITESVLLHESEANLTTLHELKKLGVRISMDDFGTGYSSLSYLRSFPFDKIKIDQTFIHDLPERDDCLAIVRAVTSLGDSLGMTTTAEGVETKEQADKLRAEGCGEVQGFLFSPPKPAGEIRGLLGNLAQSAAA
jgi:diguanylate cyclase (GGDEF)-like protein